MTRRACLPKSMGFPGGSVVKNPPANAVDEDSIPGQEDPLEKEIATHFSILAWRIAWTEEQRATVHGVAKSRTQLSDFTFTFMQDWGHWLGAVS